MTKKTLTVVINKPVAEVFLAAINPANTPLWISTMAEEQTSQWPVALGATYRNRGHSGGWTQYSVSKFQLNKLFELTQSDGDYRVEYIFTPKGPGATQLQYTEWVTSGTLDNPLSQATLDKLKALIEAQ